MADSSPAPTLPACCPAHRLPALAAVAALVTTDAFGTFDRLVDAGWTPTQALDNLRTSYRDWIGDIFGAAVDEAVVAIARRVER